MSRISLYDEQRYLFIVEIIPRYLFIVAAGYFTAIFTTKLWVENVALVHTIMELFCIFIAISTFFIIWHSYSDTFGIFRVFGFGMLSVAIFNSFHTYLSLINMGAVQHEYELSVRFWAVGMLVESLTILYLSLNLKETIVKKWKRLFLVLFITFGISYALIIYSDNLPSMFEIQGTTVNKIIFDCIIIFISIISLHNLKFKLKDENDKTYKYLFMALLFVISSQIVLIRYDAINGLNNMYAHILRVVYYFYLYKAVYVCAIEHPYKKLAEAYLEKENANERIKEISDGLNNTLDAVPIGILNFDKDSRVKYMNKQLEEILACNRNDYYGLKLAELKEYFPIIDTEGNLAQSIDGRSNNSERAIIGIRNLKNEYVKLSITSQNIENEVLIYIYAVKREQEIKYFHLQTQTILNAVSNAILMIDNNKKIILYNDAFKRICELDKLEILGMDLDRFNEMISFKARSLVDMLTKKKALEHPEEITITTYKGNRIEMLNYMAPIVNVEGVIIGAISIGTDISEIKKHQHNMQQQEKLALIGQMTAGIVHEIKNPLATIKGLSQLISAKTQMNKIKEYSNVINSAIDDITNVVNDFLTFAKPKPTVITRTSINKIVESMQLITETQCYTKNIRSQFHYSSCPMEITADEIKIKQVVLNISENAIFALEGVESPELVVSTYYNVDKMEGVIEVSDNGTGMGPEVLYKLGTPFFTTKEKGTGLGLGISYQIMEEHNGRIEVESEEGKGTIFRIIFTQIEDLL